MQEDIGKETVRRNCRIAVVQFLYMWESNPSETLKEGLNVFFEEQEQPRAYYAFAEELIRGICEKKVELDETIKGLATNWTFSRIAKVDLAILRLALYEFYYRLDIPPIVSINEAIELSKLFSSVDSKRFINGVLDKAKQTLARSLRKASSFDGETLSV